MFIGRYYHTLEAKNRLSLPKAFRDIEANWIITRGLDGGLFGFRQNEFEKQLQELTQRTFTVKQNRDFVRLMTNDAYATAVDNQGRVQLPEYLTELADLQKQVVVVGSYNWIEIWNAERYHQYLDGLEKEAESISEQVGQNIQAQHGK